MSACFAFVPTLVGPVTSRQELRRVIISNFCEEARSGIAAEGRRLLAMVA